MIELPRCDLEPTCRQRLERLILRFAGFIIVGEEKFRDTLIEPQYFALLLLI